MRLVWISALTAVLLLSAAARRSSAHDRQRDSLSLFESSVRPILVARCLKCHSASKSESGLRLDDYSKIIHGGDSGPAMVPGHAEKSLLVKAIRRQDGLEMPPDGPLEAHEVAALVRWIEEGAAWPAGHTIGPQGPRLRSGAITNEERAFWAFQPITHPLPPQLDDSFPVRNAIDRFIGARLSQAGLRIRRQADRRTLLRRATFDLIGLPPTPDEIEAFISDDAPNAFDKVVDRLLASPQYGERWGRHWLDVVRYADTAGETADYPTPLAYKYRNWVIRSFNSDKPYDELIREQIAGDILAERLIENLSERPDQETLEQYQDMLTATGFIAISRRFGFDIEKWHTLTIQDTLDTIGQSMLGLTIGCARCHDHKYDPINVDDYYAWYGIFDSTRYSFPGSEQKKQSFDLLSALPPALTNSDAQQWIYGAAEQPEPKDARIQIRGDRLKFGESVPRRNLEILGNDPLLDDTASGRLELANWLSRPDNPLTARVMANRIWQQHFGRGIVGTESDFGTRGEAPTHPDLLDWLASQFIQSSWSVKAMHRLIMASATYQQASDFDLLAAETDPESRLLWRFNRRRLSAEEIRDAMLFVSGELDFSTGLEHPFPPAEKWGFTQHSPFYAVYDTNRRSVYLMQQRLKRHPFLGLFDGADTSASTARRQMTTVPTQALYLMNSDFVHEQGAAFARRVSDVCGSIEHRVAQAYVLALGRPVRTDELTEAVEFIRNYEILLQAEFPESPMPTEIAAWSALSRSLLTQNEFLFVD